MKLIRKKSFLDELLGFPLIFSYVDVWIEPFADIALINYEKVNKLVLPMLATVRRRLVGAEICYIRKNLDFTLQDFAERLGCTHAAVKNWENHKASPTRMAWPTEKDIRLLILLRLKRPAGEVVRLLSALENPSEYPPIENPEPFVIDGDAVTMLPKKETKPRRKVAATAAH